MGFRRVVLCCLLAACGRRGAGDGASRVAITIAASAVGDEGVVLARQVRRFELSHAGVRVEIRRTPDDATQRHQLFVQWLNAHVGQPDVLQLDVVWTAEFAAAGWILPLDRWSPAESAFFPSVLRADRWNGHLYALPWFADVGLLYRRTDLVARAPRTLDDLIVLARRGMSGAARDSAGVRGPAGVRGAAASGAAHGIVWQGARYEGLVTVFLEYLGAFGGRILDDDLRVTVDAPAGVRALTFMRDEIGRDGVTPRDVLTWHEEETRFAFQNGTAVFMRNWPYAYALLADSTRSRVAGRFAVSIMPAGSADGHPTAALGGAQLAVNAWSAHPALAYALAAYLTAPAQMLERASVVGQFPTRVALYDDPRLARALAIPVRDARDALMHAEPRPAVPIYTQMSDILQIQLHRALAGEADPAASLHAAARSIRALIERTRLEAAAAR